MFPRCSPGDSLISASNSINPAIIFEELGGIRDAIKYGTYMNRCPHKLLFHRFEQQLRYKMTWNQLQYEIAESPCNSKSCSYCGRRGYRQERRSGV